MTKKMGIKFLSSFLAWGAFVGLTEAKDSVAPSPPRILLPPPPKESEPPLEEPSELNRKIKEKRKERVEQEKKEENEKKTPEERQIEILDDKTRRLIKEGSQEKPFQFHMAVSLVLPKIVTSGNERKNYIAEPTAFLHVFIRPSSSQPTDKTEFWTGFRFAPINGTGVYKNNAGRFCFNYFGPMFGIGNFDPPVKENSGEKLPVNRMQNEEEEKKEEKSYTRWGYFWMSGIALQNRISSVERDREVPGEDLNSKGADLDVPGIWTEFHFTSFHYNSFGTDYLFGIQMGKGKDIAYIGIAFGLWH
ncbi:MAG: hypothetical protein HQK54_04505 [Oligoflexales bacterium]|nr:hypothetical protein [Oligoflexales bacterium]